MSNRTSKKISPVAPCCCPHCGHCTKSEGPTFVPWPYPVVQPYRPPVNPWWTPVIASDSTANFPPANGTISLLGAPQC